MTKTGSILPEETLNAILRTGSNHNRTELRLIYNFMSVQTKEEYEEFVRNGYRNNLKLWRGLEKHGDLRINTSMVKS